MWFKITEFSRPTFSTSNYSRASRVFNFAFLWAIPRHAPVWEIWCSPVKEVEAHGVSWCDAVISILPESNSSHFSTTLQTGNMWAYSYYGSRWVHTDTVIHFPPEINNHFVTTLPNPEWYFLIMISLSINRSALLVSMNVYVVWMRYTCREIFITYKYSRQQDMFDPSAVVVFRLIYCKFLSVIFSKRFVQWWFWYLWRFLSAADNDWPAVVHNLQRAWKKWVRLY